MKRFNVMYDVGRSRHLVNFHDGIKKHNDGSDFFDMKIFKNKKSMNIFIAELIADDYVQKKMDIYN